MTPPMRGDRLMRDAALSLSLRHDFSRGLVNPRQSQPYEYVDSALNACPERLIAAALDRAGPERESLLLAKLALLLADRLGDYESAAEAVPPAERDLS